MRFLIGSILAVLLVTTEEARPVRAQTPVHTWRPTRIEADHLYRDFEYKDAALIYQDLALVDSTDFYLLTRTTQSWNFRGLDQQSLGLKDSAEVAFERAVNFAEQTKRHHPDSSLTWVNLAAAYGNLALFRGGKDKVRMGRQVEQYCNLALEIDSTDVMALTILGVFNRELSKLGWLERLVAKAIYGSVPKGSIEKSVEYLQRAISVDSTMLFPNYSLAVTFSRMKREEDALKQLRKVTGLNATNSEEARYKEKAEKWLEDSRIKKKKQ